MQRVNRAARLPQRRSTAKSVAKRVLHARVVKPHEALSSWLFTSCRQELNEGQITFADRLLDGHHAWPAIMKICALRHAAQFQQFGRELQDFT